MTCSTQSLGRWLAIAVFVVGGGVSCGHKNNGNPGDAPGGDTGTGDGPVFLDASTVDAPSCGLNTCASEHAMCGLIGDGCTGTIDCGSCPMGESCGGGGVHFQCGSAGGSGSGSGVCTKRTCADDNAKCGVVADGCGGVTADCGTCPSGETCGAGGVANQCAGPPCVGPLCGQINACTGSGQMPTTLSGIVTAPGHDDVATWGSADPIYDALVYVPNGSGADFGVDPFGSGVACDTCSSEVTGNPLVSQVTGVDGKFTLTNVPCGSNVPLVMQLGRWRRMITIPNVQCCMPNALTGAETHLPRNQVGSAGDVYSDIPKMAFDTGSVDTLHCVLRQIGVDDTEFTDPSGTGRINFFKDNGAKIDNATPAASTLYGSAAELAKYDISLFECVGSEVAKGSADQQRIIDYANAGGRVYATHFSYVWLTDATGSAGNTGPKPFSQTAGWDTNQGDFDNGVIGVVDETLQSDAGTQARRIAFANWLKGVGASTTLGQIPVNVVREDMNFVSSSPATMLGAPAQQWLKNTNLDGNSFVGPLHYTFDTPVAYAPTPVPTTECGRVLFSDFHVSNATASGKTFPSECQDQPMNAQEKTLEFMLFDLASCVGQQTVTCTPQTCAQQHIDCGESGDGCDDGMVLQCGGCGSGQTCGGGGPGMCGGGVSCMPLTCASQDAQCGIIGDGCGSDVNCGPCPMGQVCGGSGVANQCANQIIQ